jgi:hypothetical protein
MRFFDKLSRGLLRLVLLVVRQHDLHRLEVRPILKDTCSLEMNSHTPSLAIIINLSLKSSVKSKISGSCEHPTEAATRSPSDLDMANPGIF